MKLEAGKTYLNRKGERVTVRLENPGSHYPFKGSDGEEYTSEGTFWAYQSYKDLMAEAPQEDSLLTGSGTRNPNVPEGLVPIAKRKIVQISTAYCDNPGAFVAVACDDGSVWVRSVRGTDPWLQLPEIP